MPKVLAVASCCDYTNLIWVARESLWLKNLARDQHLIYCVTDIHDVLLQSTTARRTAQRLRWKDKFPASAIHLISGCSFETYHQSKVPEIATISLLVGRLIESAPGLIQKMPNVPHLMADAINWISLFGEKTDVALVPESMTCDPPWLSSLDNKEIAELLLKNGPAQLVREESDETFFGQRQRCRVVRQFPFISIYSSADKINKCIHKYSSSQTEASLAELYNLLYPSEQKEVAEWAGRTFDLRRKVSAALTDFAGTFVKLLDGQELDYGLGASLDASARFRENFVELLRKVATCMRFGQWRYKA